MLTQSFIPNAGLEHHQIPECDHMTTSDVTTWAQTIQATRPQPSATAIAEVTQRQTPLLLHTCLCELTPARVFVSCFPRLLSVQKGLGLS